MKRLLITGLAALVAGSAFAAENPPPRRLDPYVPPAARIRSAEPPTDGPALQAQVQDKLRRRFDMADAARFGSITRVQAERAGFGFVAQHFERIDSRRSGSISFDELMRYLQQQR